MSSNSKKKEKNETPLTPFQRFKQLARRIVSVPKSKTEKLPDDHS